MEKVNDVSRVMVEFEAPGAAGIKAWRFEGMTNEQFLVLAEFFAMHADIAKARMAQDLRSQIAVPRLVRKP